MESEPKYMQVVIEVKRNDPPVTDQVSNWDTEYKYMKSVQTDLIPQDCCTIILNGIRIEGATVALDLDHNHYMVTGQVFADRETLDAYGWKRIEYDQEKTPKQ